MTKGTSVREIASDLDRIAQRDTFNAKVVVIDNVPLCNDPQQSEMCMLLKRTLLKKAEKPHVMQDFFHIMHNVSPEFNNTHPLFHFLAIVKFRQAIKRLDPDAEAQLDLKLERGEVAKKITYRGMRIEVKPGEKTSKEKINEWKESGAYHDMFSKYPTCIVPECIVGSDELIEAGLTEWFNIVKAAAFDANDKPICTGKGGPLIASVERLKEITSNAITRCKAARHHNPKPAPSHLPKPNPNPYPKPKPNPDLYPYPHRTTLCFTGRRRSTRATRGGASTRSTTGCRCSGHASTAARESLGTARSRCTIATASLATTSTPPPPPKPRAPPPPPHPNHS